VLAHSEVTGLATAGDVKLLKYLLLAERDRVSMAEAEDRLAVDEEYSSPFIAMPF
jgi:hypothetical protein